MENTVSTLRRHAEKPLVYLVRIGALALAIGLPVVLGGAPVLANAGVSVIAQHAQPAQIQRVRPFGGCPGDGTPC